LSEETEPPAHAQRAERRLRRRPALAGDVRGPERRDQVDRRRPGQNIGRGGLDQRHLIPRPRRGDPHPRQIRHSRVHLDRRDPQAEGPGQPDRHGGVAGADIEDLGACREPRVRDGPLDRGLGHAVADLERLIGDAGEGHGHRPSPWRYVQK